MNRAVSVSMLAILSLGGCSELGLPVETETQEVLLGCVDMVTYGDCLDVTINSQEQYDWLIFERFTKPLQNHWNANYQSVLGVQGSRTADSKTI